MITILRNTIRQLLRPLVSYAIHQGFTLPAFVDLLKTLYVEEALHQDHARPPTDSHLSLMTGIHRKDIKRLRAAVDGEEETGNITRKTHIAAELIALWASTAALRDHTGTLRSLPLHSADEPSFASLAQRLKADMRPRAILDDLIRAKAVHILDDGRISLLREAYVPGVPEEKLRFLAQNVGDHMACAFHNLDDKPPLLERALFLNAIPKREVEAAKPRIEALADHLLQSLHRELTPFESQDKNHPDTRRVRIGVYYYEDAPSPVRENDHDTRA